MLGTPVRSQYDYNSPLEEVTGYFQAKTGYYDPNYNTDHALSNYNPIREHQPTLTDQLVNTVGKFKACQAVQKMIGKTEAKADVATHGALYKWLGCDSSTATLATPFIRELNFDQNSRNKRPFDIIRMGK